MLTHLYPSSPQKESGKTRFMNYAEMLSPYACVLVTDQKPDRGHLTVSSSFVHSHSVGSSVNAQNIKVLKGKHNDECSFVALQQKNVFKIKQSPD